jgi:hypothetical protein
MVWSADATERASRRGGKDQEYSQDGEGNRGGGEIIKKRRRVETNREGKRKRDN